MEFLQDLYIVWEPAACRRKRWVGIRMKSETGEMRPRRKVGNREREKKKDMEEMETKNNGNEEEEDKKGVLGKG